MLAVDGYAVLVEQAADLVQQRFVQRRGATQRERQAVADERESFGERTKRLAKLAADVDPVFRRDFEEVDGGMAALCESVLQRADEGPPQAESRAARSASRHLSARCRSLPCPSCRRCRSLPYPSCRRCRNLPCPWPCRRHGLRSCTCPARPCPAFRCTSCPW